MPNALLERYFTDRGLFAAWLALPEEQRKPMDAEFQDIFEVSCAKGF